MTSQNDVAIRGKLQSMALDLHQLQTTQDSETADRQKLLVELRQFMFVLQERSDTFLQLAADLHVRSDLRLNDMSESFRTEFDTHMNTTDSTATNPISEGPSIAKSSGDASVPETLPVGKQAEVISKPEKSTSTAYSNGGLTHAPTDGIPVRDMENIAERLQLLRSDSTRSPR
jgi:hypothetical protein